MKENKGMTSQTLPSLENTKITKNGPHDPPPPPPSIKQQYPFGEVISNSTYKMLYKKYYYKGIYKKIIIEYSYYHTT